MDNKTRIIELEKEIEKLKEESDRILTRIDSFYSQHEKNFPDKIDFREQVWRSGRESMDAKETKIANLIKEISKLKGF